MWKKVSKVTRSVGYTARYSNLFAVIVSKSGDIFLMPPVLKALGFDGPNKPEDGVELFVGDEARMPQFAIKPAKFTAATSGEVFKIAYSGGTNAVTHKRINPTSFTQSYLVRGGVYTGAFDRSSGMAVFGMKPVAIIELPPDKKA